jgi:flagellar P-ring protein FlgI
MRNHLQARIPLLFLGLTLALPTAATATERIKDLAQVQGVRDNQLFGYGLVVGLNGTGDDQQVLFTAQSLSGMLGRLGVRINPKDMSFRDVAAVMVTASLPTFSRPGTHIDVSVSAMGNTRSLEGGVLLITPLAGADGVVYAVAQGALQVGGFQVSAAGSSLRKNQPNSGIIPEGATVERAVTPDLSAGPLMLELKVPDFTTASRIAAAINKALGDGSAKATDPASVEVTSKDPKITPVEVMQKIERLEVDADSLARVAISERTGTIVAGENVRLRPVMVAHGGLQISVVAHNYISQPAPFSLGRTRAGSNADITASEQSNAAVALPSTTTVTDLTKAMNALGANPRDLVEILQAMKAAGALDAELQVF